MIQQGTKLLCEVTGSTVTIQSKIGQGGQGIVYKVSDGKQQYALKWYNAEQSNESQKEALRFLIQHGAPKGAAGKRFVWPVDLVVSKSSSQFGYIMPLMNLDRYASMMEVWSRRKPAPLIREMCEVSYQIANSYRALHLEGLCYRDVSSGNFVFDPQTGDVLICDNDNVGIDQQSLSQVRGTWPYMAPEVVKRGAKPSTKTDLHSLAVLLFQFWLRHHPLEGKIESSVRCWDDPAKRQIYGEMPIFIFDPQDQRNKLPNSPDYQLVQSRWQHCPPPLQEMFMRAFTLGLHKPDQRVTEGEWQNLFSQMMDLVLDCPSDGKQNFSNPRSKSVTCWKCNTPFSVPPKLLVQTASGQRCLLLSKNAQLLGRHLQPLSEEKAADVVGQVVQNPSDPAVWGLRNLSATPWIVTFPDGTSQPVPPQRAAPFVADLKIQIGQTVAQILI